MATIHAASSIIKPSFIILIFSSLCFSYCVPNSTTDVDDIVSKAVKTYSRTHSQSLRQIVCGWIGLPRLPMVWDAVSKTVWNFSRKWVSRMYRSWAAVVTQGCPALGRSLIDPIWSWRLRKLLTMNEATKYRTIAATSYQHAHLLISWSLAIHCMIKKVLNPKFSFRHFIVG